MREEKHLNRVCLNAVREILGLDPLHYEPQTEEAQIKAGPRITIPWIAERIKQKDPRVSVDLVRKKGSTRLRVHLNEKQLLDFNGSSYPMRQLLAQVETHWGRIWE